MGGLAAQGLVHIGTYGKGIYSFSFDPRSGETGSVSLAAEIQSPSFLAYHPNGRFLYAVNETDKGSVTAFSIDGATGKLRQLNQVSSHGGGPCHLALDQTGKMLMVANYGTGSVSAFPVHSDGTLGEATAFIQHEGKSADPKRQQGPHAHSVTVSPDNRFVVAADLGLDKLFVYRMDPAKASLTPNDPPYAQVKPGSGPRHFAFDAHRNRAYAINEMASTVIAFNFDPHRGALQEIQTISTLPTGFAGESTTAEIAIDAKGKFLYGSNRGHDSIAVFSIDQTSGKLALLETVPTGGKVPRNFGIDRTGHYLFAANQKADNIVIFRIDENTGRLKATGKVLQVPSPVCVIFR
jgi:6-phosphogluconolactonase